MTQHGGALVLLLMATATLTACASEPEVKPVIQEDPITQKKQACLAGNMKACNSLGVAYISGRGVERDPKRAIHFFERACGYNFAAGCFNHGMMLHTGDGMAKDAIHAVLLFQKACHEGHARACETMASLGR